MGKINGCMYRALINDKEIAHEFSCSFEPEEIKITVLVDYKVYDSWLKRKGEKVNFKLSNTEINLDVVIKHVILLSEANEAVRMFIKLG